MLVATHASMVENAKTRILELNAAVDKDMVAIYAKVSFTIRIASLYYHALRLGALKTGKRYFSGILLLPNILTLINI